MTTAFVKLQMFKDQNSRKASSPSLSSATSTPSTPFLQWKVGHIIKGKNSNGTETWTIKKIASDDGAMHYQDTLVTIQNQADEKRELKGSTLQSGYEFVSAGDVKEDAPSKELVVAEKPARDDCTYIVVNVAGIREFYPRKRGDGTRILMQDKTAYIVADPCDDVLLQIKQAVAASLAGLVA